jgi:hypothetical protein
MKLSCCISFFQSQNKLYIDKHAHNLYAYMCIYVYVQAERETDVPAQKQTEKE